jgi:hypothetical protein
MSRRNSILLAALVFSFLTACSGAQSTISSGPLPQSVGREPVAPLMASSKQGKSFTRPLNPAGGLVDVSNP